MNSFQDWIDFFNFRGLSNYLKIVIFAIVWLVTNISIFNFFNITFSAAILLFILFPLRKAELLTSQIKVKNEEEYFQNSWIENTTVPYLATFPILTKNGRRKSVGKWHQSVFSRADK